MNCPNCGEVSEHDAVWVSMFKETRDMPEEGIYTCPGCHAILDED